MEFPNTSRKTATPLTAKEKALDVHGITNPDLYRRVDGNRKPHTDIEQEVLQRDYKFSIVGDNSFRTTKTFIQDENSDVSEIP